VARARNVTHYYRLRQLGVTMIERETLDSALLSARSVLQILGMDPLSAQASAERFRAHTIELIEQMAPHFGDEAKLISLAKLGRQQFEEMWARERAQRDAAARAEPKATPPKAPSDP
jgi:glutathione-regulated potassium-efflux system ancillary protein KefC